MKATELTPAVTPLGQGSNPCRPVRAADSPNLFGVACRPVFSIVSFKSAV